MLGGWEGDWSLTRRLICGFDGATGWTSPSLAVDLLDVARQHPGWLTGLGIASVLTFFGTLAIVPWLLARMPADYFLRERPYRERGHPRFWWWLAGHLVKDLAAGILILAGIAMLVLPGQGILTILLGLSLIDLPGKRKLELWLVRRPRVLHGINWLRRRAGRPPLQVDDASNRA